MTLLMFALLALQEPQVVQDAPVAQDSTEAPAGSPMYNPFGCLKLVSLHDIAEAN